MFTVAAKTKRREMKLKTERREWAENRRKWREKETEKGRGINSDLSHRYTKLTRPLFP